MKIIINEWNYPNCMFVAHEGRVIWRVAFRIYRRAFDFGMYGWRPFAHIRRVLL